MKSAKGMTLIEILLALAIFSVVMAALYSAYSVQVRQAVKEYRRAESDIELQIAKSIIERDIAMAGFGLADDYSGLFAPAAIDATDASPDTLTLMGTALGRGSRAAQAWSYALNDSPSGTDHFKNWTDASYTIPADSRENLKVNDRVIYIDPEGKRLLSAQGKNSVTGRTWLFTYPPSQAVLNAVPDSLELGTLAFGLLTKPDREHSGNSANFPYYVVRYYLGNPSSSPVPALCAPNTRNLLRAESNKDDAAGGQPVMNCVAAFEVAFGLDTNEDGTIECWDNGGDTARGYDAETLKTRLKQVKISLLLQEGGRDETCSSVNPDPAYAADPGKIRVGDDLLTACEGGGMGSIYTLSADQRKYPWRVVTMSVVPRNLR